MKYLVFQGDLVQGLLGGEANPQPVAVVEAEDLQQAFEVSNSHGDAFWGEQAGVVLLSDVARSTSVGDLLVTEQLEVYEVAFVDFELRTDLPLIVKVAADVFGTLPCNP